MLNWDKFQYVIIVRYIDIQTQAVCLSMQFWRNAGCIMRIPSHVLKSLEEQSCKNKDYSFDRLYRNLYNPDFYMEAYKRIAKSQGSMTAGVGVVLFWWFFRLSILFRERA